VAFIGFAKVFPNPVLAYFNQLPQFGRLALMLQHLFTIQPMFYMIVVVLKLE
jgi:hypothetical protein